MANIEIFGTLVRNDNNTNRDKIVQATQVEGGYFVCETLPTNGTWKKGQLCYCTGTASKPVDKFYQYNGSSWVPAIDHTHPYLPSDTLYAGSSSQGGAATSANKVNSTLTITLNDGTNEDTNKFTFDGSAAKTVNITSPGCNNGIEKNNNNEFVLTDAFYKYLLEKTFATPNISSFSLTGTNTSGSKEVGTTVSVTGITHYEANIANISGNLTLSRGSGAGVTTKTVSSSIAKSSKSTTVNVTDSFTATTNGTVTYTLSAPYTDTTGASKTATAKASVSFYWPVFYGATNSVIPSSQTGLTKAASFGSDMLSINTTATNKHIQFLSTGTIELYNSLKLPITPGDTGTVEITVNGQKTTYNYATIKDCIAGTNQIYVNI